MGVILHSISTFLYVGNWIPSHRNIQGNDVHSNMGEVVDNSLQSELDTDCIGVHNIRHIYSV